MQFVRVSCRERHVGMVLCYVKRKKNRVDFTIFYLLCESIVYQSTSPNALWYHFSYPFSDFDHYHFTYCVVKNDTAPKSNRGIVYPRLVICSLSIATTCHYTHKNDTSSVSRAETDHREHCGCPSTALRKHHTNDKRRQCTVSWERTETMDAARSNELELIRNVGGRHHQRPGEQKHFVGNS